MSDPSSPFSSSRSKDKQPSPTRTNTRRRQQQQPHATPPTGTPSSSRRRSPPSSGSSAYEPIDFRLPDPLHPDEHPHQHLAPLQEETATPPDGSEHAEPTTAAFPIVPTMLPPSTSPWSAGTEVSSRYDHGQREREYDDSSRSSHRRAYPQHHYQYSSREAYQGSNRPAPPSPPFLPSSSSRYQHHYRQGTRYQDYSYDYPRHPGGHGQQQHYASAASGHHDAVYHPPYRRSSSSLEYSSANVSLPEEVPEAPEVSQSASSGAPSVAQQVTMSGETSASAETSASTSSRRPAHPGARSRHEQGSSDQRRYQEPRPPRMLPPSYTLVEPQHRDHHHSRSDRRPPQDQDTAAVDQPARHEAHHYQASDPRRDASSFESQQSAQSSAAHSHQSAHSRTSSDAAHSSSSATPTHGPYRGGYRTQHPVAHPVSSSSSAAAAHHHPSYAPEGPPSSSRGQPRPSYAQQEALERHYGAPAAAAAGPGGSGEGTSPPPYPPAIPSSSSYSTYPSGPPPPPPSRHYPHHPQGYGGPPGHGPPPPPPPPHPHPSAYPPYHPGMYPPPPPYYGAGGPAPLPFVYDINTNDVLCGRGGATNSHVGNRSFRSLVKSHQDRYLRAKKKEKPAVAAHIVELVRNLNPSGRFLKKDKETGYWYDIGDDRAKEKTSQALREGAPAIRRKRDREGSSGGGSDGGDRSRDGDDDGSPDSKAARSSNTVSPGGSTTARGMSHEEDEHGSKGGDSGDDGETGGSAGGKKHHRRRSVVEIEEVHIDEDEDDHSVEYEVTEEQVQQQGGNVLVSPGDGREAGAEASDRSTSSNVAAADVKVEEGRDEGPSSSTDQSDREQDSTAGDSDEDQPGTADGTTTKKRVRTSRRRPIVIRPALALTKQKLAEIKIEELSPQERATYAANFIPPRPNLQRGPRDGRRRIIRVSAEGLADI